MRWPVLYSLALGMILSVYGTAARGGATVQQLNSAADLDLSGDIVYAINFGDNGSPTVGGVVFSQDEDYASITLDALDEGPAIWFGQPAATADAGLNRLMNGFAFRYGTYYPLEISVNVGGLVIGRLYLLQIIGYEPDSQSRDIDIIVEDNEFITGLNPIVEQGGVVGQGGLVMKDEFIAGDPILNIRMLSHYNALALSGFILTEIAVPPLTITGAASRKTHGDAGAFDLDLPLDAENAGIEGRAGGPTTVVLTFSEPVQAPEGGPLGTVKLSAGTLQDVSIDGAEMTIELSDVPDETCLVITVEDITALDGWPLTGDTDVHVRVLKGAITDDDIVDVSDMSRVKGSLFDPLDDENFRADVTADGEIDVSDMSAVKGSLFNSAACP